MEQVDEKTALAKLLAILNDVAHVHHRLKIDA
jgi:hypothetical protein